MPERRPHTDAWSIDDGYFDATGVWRETSPAIHDLLVAAMGEDPGAGAPPPRPRVLVARSGETRTVGARGELVLEDGRRIAVDDHLPADLPLGYHELRDRDVLRVIVAPARCHLPEPFRTWGWAAQLYATRSRESWGIGDLADLRRLGRWSARTLGAGVVLINPLAAAGVTIPQQPSPYFPSSRRFRNPLYIAVEHVPGYHELSADLEPLSFAGRALNGERRIDRDRVFEVKLRALERLWRKFAGAADFERFRAECAGLREFATFCALGERHGRAWQTWPDEHRRPGTPGVERFVQEHADRVAFHEWLQWLLDVQLAVAGQEIAVMQDLPIGVDPDGADAWIWQDVLARGVSVGAPPDRYVIAGQDWGLPPFAPHRLAAAGYEPFVQTVRAALRHAGGLRIDHVMGLFRLFWIPQGHPPAEGAFVRYDADDLLAIVALESVRAGAFVVGEDLGTVEEGVRERLAAHAILSYKVVWFEPEPPVRFPRLALAAVTTHDLPTIAGLWTGVDVEQLRAAGVEPNERGLADMRARLGAMIDLGPDAPVPRVVEATHELLAEAPSAVVTVTLEDALLVSERPNIPGTTVPTNWSLALPKPLEEIEADPVALRVARAVGQRGR
jgi:4-alpha-glucanotransferase